MWLCSLGSRKVDPAWCIVRTAISQPAHLDDSAFSKQISLPYSGACLHVFPLGCLKNRAKISHIFCKCSVHALFCLQSIDMVGRQEERAACKN